MSADTVHQLLVQFPNDPDAKRYFFEACDAVLQSDHVIADFPEVFRAAVYHGTCLRGLQFTECGLRALNLARQNGLAPHERTHQDVRIG